MLVNMILWTRKELEERVHFMIIVTKPP